MLSSRLSHFQDFPVIEGDDKEVHVIEVPIIEVLVIEVPIVEVFVVYVFLVGILSSRLLNFAEKHKIRRYHSSSSQSKQAR